jgi:uncharacterized membrane protein
MRRPRRPIRPVTGEVVIERPIQEVYGFYRDFSNLPRFLGDVVAVQQVTHTRYRWVVEGPFGARVRFPVVVTDEQKDRLLRYRSGGPPLLRGRWELSFVEEAGAGSTRVRERLLLPLGALGRAALGLAGKFPQREITANLAGLKRLLEAQQDAPGPAAAPSGQAR